MMAKLTGILLCCFGFAAFSQTTIVFDPVFGNRKINPENTFYKLPSGDSLSIETLKFYISNIRLLKNNKTVFAELDGYHLIDAFNPKSLIINYESPQKIDYNQIAFTIGIDSLTNVSGAMAGDLDATKGMYWSWQSGYINFKVEGKSNLYKARKNEFFFHLGGYLSPNQTAQQVVLKVASSQKITIQADLKKFVLSFPFGTTPSTMVPGEKAKLLSLKLPEIFAIE